MRQTVIAVLILGSALCAAAARAQDGLGKAFGDARESIVRFQGSVAGARSDAAVRSQESFVPAGCAVESWCLVKATDCFLGQITQPTGLWKAYAQYSVVRRAVALCQDGYGRWQRQSFMGPVEPQVFSSAIEVDEKTASDSALKLCTVYRKDWVDAAPLCAAN